MRTGNIASNGSKIRHDLKTLLIRWDQAKDEWDDVVSRDFEEKQLAPIQQAVSQATQVIDELQQFLGRMIKAVGPEE